MSSQALEAFSTAFHEGQAALNRGDFRGAVADFAPDFEWWPAEDIPDWHVEAVELSEARDGVFLVRLRATGSGATSGAPGEFGFSQVWELDNDGVPVRCREFTDHAEALAAAAE